MSTQNSVVSTKVADFFAQYPEQRFTKGEVIVHAGEEPQGVLYLLSGRVNQYDISPAGTEVVVNIFKSPAFFSVAWAINRTPNQYFFEAAESVVARQAPADEVVAFLQREPEVLFDLLSRVYRGTDGVLRRVAHLMGGDARSRLIFEILNAAYRFGEAEAGGVVRISVSEGELAKRSGMTRETASRVIRGLKAARLVEVTKAGLVLRNVKKLEAELGPHL